MPNKDLVLDSWALIELFSKGPKGEKVLDILQQSVSNLGSLYLSAINWGEVLYVTEMRLGEGKRKLVKKKIQEMGLIIVPTEEKLIEAAASLKAQTQIPYADAFAAATAIQEKAPLLTGDSDFKSLEKKINILWL